MPDDFDIVVEASDFGWGVGYFPTNFVYHGIVMTRGD